MEVRTATPTMKTMAWVVARAALGWNPRPRVCEMKLVMPAPRPMARQLKSMRTGKMNPMAVWARSPSLDTNQASVRL